MPAVKMLPPQVRSEVRVPNVCNQHDTRQAACMYDLMLKAVIKY